MPYKDPKDPRKKRNRMAADARFYAAHPEKCREHAKRYHHFIKETEAYKKRRRAQRLKTYGLSVEVYARMMVSQGGVCAICKRPETYVRNGQVCTLAVDHDHDTGIVRGLLCNNCNRAIGLLRDDAITARAVAAYLEKDRG